MQPLRQAGGQTRTGAGASDGDALLVDPEEPGRLPQPLPGGEDVVESGREGMFGGEAVVRRDDDDAQLASCLGAEGVVLDDIIDDVPAAVHPQQRRPRTTTSGDVQAHALSLVDLADVDALDRLARPVPDDQGANGAPPPPSGVSASAASAPRRGAAPGRPG